MTRPGSAGWGRSRRRRRKGEAAASRLKPSFRADDNRIVNSFEPREPSSSATDAAAVVDGLRERRLAVVAELRRCSHLRRLLRARLDLTIAQVLEEPAGPLGALPDPLLLRATSPWTTAMEVTVLQTLASTLAGDGRDDLVPRLEHLDLALRDLRFHVEALQAELEDVTARYVGALGADPAACLAPTG